MADNINQTLEDLTVALNAATTGLAECCQLKGGMVNPTQSDGEVQTGPGEQFPDQESYFNAKCSVANGIYDTIKGLADWLENNNAEMVIGSFGGITAAISLGLLFAGPVGWAAIAVESTLVGISAWAFSQLFDFEDMQQFLIDVKDELVISLYNASDTVVARDSFLAVLDTATPTPTTAEKKLIQYALSSAVLNQLFSPRADVAAYTSPDPTDCGSALQTWSFPSSGQGWTFRDDSTGSYSASGVWNSGAEAWRITLVGLGTGTGPRAEGKIFITGLSIAVELGNSVQFDHGASSDSVITGRNIKVIFSDMSEQYYDAPSTATAGTAILSIEASKTIAEIEIGLTRNWQQAFNMYRDIEEVRVQ